MSLKEFFDSHREEFDDRNPSDRVWAKIAPEIRKKSVFNAMAVWRAAAILFFGLSLYLFTTSHTSQHRNTSGLQTEFKDLESFYNKQIAEKVEFLDKLNSYDDDQFTQDVQKLDAMYEVLREEMKTSPSEKVKDALILNMLIRIDLLNQQIQKLEDHKKTDDGEKEI